MKDMAMSKGGLCSNAKVIMDIIVDSFGICIKIHNTTHEAMTRMFNQTFGAQMHVRVGHDI